MSVQSPAAASSVGTGPAHSTWAENSRREMIYVALAAAEMCWVTPTFAALSPETLRHRPLLLWLGMLILLLGFFYLYRALARANLSLALQQGLLVVALLLSIFLIVRYHVYGGLAFHGAEWIRYVWKRLTSITVLLPEMLASPGLGLSLGAGHPPGPAQHLG